MTREGMRAGEQEQKPINKKLPKAARRREAERQQNGRTTYDRIKAGEIEPEGRQKGWMNLQPIPINARTEEEQKEIRRKGAEAVNKIHGEVKTAKESLDRMLSILATDEILDTADIEAGLAERLRRENPNMTIYDVANAAAIGKAISGNVKAMEYIRDTRGDAPIKQVEITENITTDQDREILRQINERLQQAESIQVIEAVQIEGSAADDPGNNEE